MVSMKLWDFDYELPKELIAQYPAEKRDGCRLMVLDRKAGTIASKTFQDIAGFFKKGDLLVLNNTKVMHSRLFGKRITGGKVELFLVEKKFPECVALVRPGARIKDGETITLETGDRVEVLGRSGIGRTVRFARPIEEIISTAGHVPLPPYIDRQDEERDKIDYQTVYADKEGATASPTAGLHFTPAILDELKNIGVRIEYLTLHTNYGTFAPIKTDDVEQHKMHSEFFDLPERTAEAVNETKNSGGKIFAVGTTSTRTLEYCARDLPAGRLNLSAESGQTDMFIYPGYKFRVVDHLITNFHLPKSTLILLVSAFAGRDFIMDAYRRAIEERYRFFSYGDSMLIL